MKKIFYAAMASIGVLAMTGCSDEYDYILEGQGYAKFSATYCNDVKVASRGDLEDALSESTILWISRKNGNDKDGVVRKYKGLDNLPQEGVLLTGGHYIAEVWAGDSVSAAFDTKYYKGSQEFDINKGDADVNITAKIANVVTSVKYETEVSDVLDNYVLTVAHTRGCLEFGSDETRKGYFMMPTGDSKLTWTLKGTNKATGREFTRTGEMQVQPCYEYIFNVKCSTSSDFGGGWLDIVIDRTEVGVEDEITLNLAPIYKGYGFEFDEDHSAGYNATIVSDQSSVGRLSVGISAAAPFTSIYLDSEMFKSIINQDDETDFDIMSAEANATWKQKLNDGGIKWSFIKEDKTMIKISFEGSLLDALGYGDYLIKIVAEDENREANNANIHIVISEAYVMPDAIDPDSPEIRTNSATLTASLLKEGITDYGIQYRELGTQAWTKVYADAPVSRADANSYSVTLKGLRPGTTYEYSAFCTVVGGDLYESPVSTFVTEAELQLPNAGFEDWTTAKAPYLIYTGAASNMFWDSGNHGSATLSKNVTTPNENIKHSGNYSILLESQFVGPSLVGKFAAGNVFAGKYLGTDGTDGILGFGRPFTGRPVKVTGYVRYEPGDIEYVTNGYTCPDPTLSKGNPDRGVIYVALMDDHTENYNGEKFPVIIKTKKGNQQLLDVESEHIIAYGKLVLNGATEGSGMVKFEFDLDYRRTDIKPTYILFTAAASEGGDYFVGGKSKMWLDDIELVY